MSCCFDQAFTYLYDRFWPQTNIDIPDGLEDLLNIDKLFIDERLDGIDVFTRKYCQAHCVIVNMTGQPLYSIYQESHGKKQDRSFRSSSVNSKLKIHDKNGKEVLMLEKPDFLNHNEVYVYSGRLKLGIIKKHDYYSQLTKLSVFNSRRRRVFEININPSNNIKQYEINSTKGQHHKIGEINKKFSDSNGEYCINPDKYGIYFFSIEFDVKEKALLLAALLLLDSNYFEC
ncbi:hypothetical protein HCN44_003845 [Aphidius gifuensis]|uniref:Phospholipid scramblase n=1 Tax=Aphidius gifuensis TaxID=684658 RepID=A0A834XY06_APHGI|nr:uncharacterized protein LOC122848125 [Aphidius gifuensis]KAF7994373.1 hypothetical protein HCN44_003845 [Aphidius gifuensis]